MLRSVVERWRGIERWKEVSATVTEVSVLSEGGYNRGFPRNRNVFFYRVTDGEIQSGELVVDSSTSVFYLEPDDTFPLRINPMQPERFYCAESGSAWTLANSSTWIFIGVALLIILSAAVLGRR